MHLHATSGPTQKREKYREGCKNPMTTYVLRFGATRNNLDLARAIKFVTRNLIRITFKSLDRCPIMLALSRASYSFASAIANP